jgi:hypothetical protein
MFLAATLEIAAVLQIDCLTRVLQEVTDTQAPSCVRGLVCMLG